MIEGKGNGSYLLGITAGFAVTTFLAALIIPMVVPGAAVVLLPAMFAGFAIALEGLAFAHMLLAKSVDWACFNAGFLAALTPLAILFSPLGLALDKVVPIILPALGIAEATFDTTNSRQGCFA